MLYQNVTFLSHFESSTLKHNYKTYILQGQPTNIKNAYGQKLKAFFLNRDL